MSGRTAPSYRQRVSSIPDEPGDQPISLMINPPPILNPPPTPQNRADRPGEGSPLRAGQVFRIGFLRGKSGRGEEALAGGLRGLGLGLEGSGKGSAFGLPGERGAWERGGDPGGDEYFQEELSIGGVDFNRGTHRPPPRRLFFKGSNEYYHMGQRPCNILMGLLILFN
jgi:hypothetical protein